MHNTHVAFMTDRDGIHHRIASGTEEFCMGVLETRLDPDGSGFVRELTDRELGNG